ncbi:hypothetical protein ACFQ5M_07000 [Agrilactobacillus yilanensis]|uniref:N-acetyltransferase domain-containing protein n=1 Tax=Agrilactobacillus yilanensis TaxID=2485997 RepID=A0ABW4J630_9LACO|nr:hypothetical protein [Agrilactobacillus yilanensis]
MQQQSTLAKAFETRLKAIEADPNLTVLKTMDQPQSDIHGQVTQYIVYTNFKASLKKQQTASIFVYTPLENIDHYRNNKVDYQSQLLFEYDPWDKKIHISVLETLGAASRLAFFDYQNHGLAQLAVQALIKIAKKNEITSINGMLSSFDGDDWDRVNHLFDKFSFETLAADKDRGLAIYRLNL